jgi:uncharacterized Tic20 family protein
MFPWRILLSFVFGVAALVSVAYAIAFGTILDPMIGVVFTFAALLFLLLCMVFAQADGRIRGEK